MGDYLNNGEKIGTMGQAYYATIEMLQKYKAEPEARYYLNPLKSCSFAFPFPEYDGKDVGEISNFHKGQMVEFIVSLPANKFKTFHKKISNHISIDNEGLNVFSPCAYDGAEISTNFNTYDVKMYLKEQVYFKGKLAVSCTCACCGNSNILEIEEAIYIAQDIKNQSEKLLIQSKYEGITNEEKQERAERSIYLLKISNRILGTYKE